MHIYIYKGLHTYIHIIYTSYPYVVGIISAVFLHVIAQTAHQARLRWSFEDLQLWGSPQMGSQKWLVYDENSSENGWFRGTHTSGNLHMYIYIYIHVLYVICLHFLDHHPKYMFETTNQLDTWVFSKHELAQLLHPVVYPTNSFDDWLIRQLVRSTRTGADWQKQSMICWSWPSKWLIYVDFTRKIQGKHG